MRVIGLTGGVAAGKSAVARILRARGVPIVDADLVAREVVEPGEPALAAIIARFGPQVLGPDGRLDRAGLRARIVADPLARRDLEAITHPAIRARILQHLADLAAAGHAIAVVEAALLVETGSWRQYDALLVVSCRPETQLQRLLARDGVDEAHARALVLAQAPLADKEAVATAIIRNDGDLAALEGAVGPAWALVASPPR